MRYVAAYLLAALGGNTSPKKSDIKNILSSVGIDVDDEKLGIVMKELEGKNLEELIAAGNEKLASVPSGGGGAVAASGGGGGGAAEEEKKEEKKEESEEESDDDMGFGLFD
uniref:60S acidic ribosomal protein P2-like n=1 Tax=Styela clava TaxID=7725 RepID=UPI0019398181|nr:60S acidic ribosomal protein P2-like [Styela clava]